VGTSLSEVDTVVEFSGREVRDPAAAVPDMGVLVVIFAISVRSRTTGGSEAFVLLTGGEVLDKVGPEANDTTAALVSCPEGEGPLEGAARVSRKGQN
jgi:hypothetical protein